MTKRDLHRAAKRWVCDRVSACLSADTGFFADVIFTDFNGDGFDEMTYGAILAASVELENELRRRGSSELGSSEV